MKKQILIIALTLLPLCLMAQSEETSVSGQINSAREKIRSAATNQVFTGFSGGMMLHIGYMFSDDPRKIFSNAGLGSEEYIKSLPKDGVGLGLGGTLRIHLLNHIHVGAEGGMTLMPLGGVGNIRMGYGGAMCDFYTTWGKVRPLIGLSLGGGAMKRMYLPKEPIVYVPEGTADTTIYNASYTKTPFFYLDPYIGMEVDLNSSMALLFRIDYMLPFGRTGSGLTDIAGAVKWNNFMTPSGPRFYVGIMFGKLKRE